MKNGQRKFYDKEIRDDCIEKFDTDGIPELLFSPNFKYGIFEYKFEGQRYVSILHLEGANKGNNLKLMPIENRNKTSQWDTNELMAFFTVDNDYCGVKTKDLDY